MKTTSLLLLLLTLGSCASTKEVVEKEITYFEGIVEFDIEYEALADHSIIDPLVATLPNRAVMQYKDGNYVRSYYLDDSLSYTILLKWEEARAYQFTPDSDTVRYTSPNIPTVRTDLTKFDVGDTILGYPTHQIVALMRDNEEGSLTEGAKLKQVYHNCLELPLNPEHYANFKDGKYNELVEKYPGISLKNETTIFYFMKMTETATKVEWQDVDLDLEIDSTMTVIQQ